MSNSQKKVFIVIIIGILAVLAILSLLVMNNRKYDPNEVIIPLTPIAKLQNAQVTKTAMANEPLVPTRASAALELMATGSQIVTSKLNGQKERIATVSPNTGVPITSQIDNRPKSLVPVEVKGLYMTGWIAGIPSRRNKLISLIDRTELNAVVLDVKDDEGQLTGDDMGITLAQQIKASYHKANLPDVLEAFRQHNIYPIARIVCFKDTLLAMKRPDLAVKTSNGNVWRDRRGAPWVDPYNQEVWKYNIDIAKAAARLGFREIQFDYVRFVSDGNIATAIYPNKTGSKEDNILNFLNYAKKELAPYNVFISADVFGLTTSVPDDLQIGQKFEKVSSSVNYICPMVYPSHYYPGTYGIANPNANPYDTVHNSMIRAVKKTQGAIIRPWLQDFSLGAPIYTATHVIAQKKAVYAAGLKEWILWNPQNKYQEGALAHE